MSAHLHTLVSIGEPGGADEMRLKIGDLARLTERTVRALRLYEEMGLLKPDERTDGGFRVYTRNAVERVRWIGKLQDLGFTLNAIQALVTAGAASHDGALVMGQVRDVFHGKLSEVREQMARLTALEAELVNSLQYLEECSGCHRGPVNVVCQSCAEPGHHPDATPSLVNGIRQPQ